MTLDFTKLGATNLVDTALDPATLFSALPRPRAASTYSYLRNVQSEVLQGWFTRRNARDLVLKMNTGAGKTIVGLLLLKSSLNEKVGPAAYITPDNYLASQVIAEARKLGIAVTSDIDQQYLMGKSILVDNIVRVVNGRSKFGINDRVPLGTIVVDDAHSCLRLAEEKFTITIPASHEAWAQLFGLFKSALEQQSPTSTLDIEAGDPAKLMAVPYWSWRDRQAEVTRILHGFRTTAELDWTWPLVKDALPNCVCIFSGKGLSISSRCLNIGLLSSFENAKRRIFMTATLADDSALVTHVGADPKSISTPVSPSSASDLGDRMILAPQQLTPAITDDEIKTFLTWAAKHWNVVVIVPSKQRAAYWVNVATQTLTADNLTDGVAKMRAGLVGLTVLVNKYDGVDLPYDACRLLVIDGLPEVDRWLDKVDASMLEDSEAMLAKHVQRIEQGMGRGIRSNDDYCVVLLLGSKLVRRMGLPAARSKFTPATLAQLSLSEKVAEQLQGKSLKEIYTDAMLLCLTQNPNWVQVSRAAVAGISSYGQQAPAARSVHQRTAFDAAMLNRYPEAAAELQKAVTDEKDKRVKGWLKQQLADYIHPYDPASAQQIQLSAQDLNRQVLKPISGVNYVKLSGAARPQAEMLSSFLQSKYSSPVAMVLGYNSILDDLLFAPDSFNKFEAAIKNLGEHLGFDAHRPEIEFGKGPDDLWALGGQRFAIIECKNEATADEISKEYIDKSAGRRVWFSDTYGPGCSAESIIVHPSRVVSKYASPEHGLRVLTPKKLEDLKTACRTLASTISSLGSFGDIQGIARALAQLGLTADQIVSRFTDTFVMGS